MTERDRLESALIFADAWGGASRAMAFRRLGEMLIAAKGGDDEVLRGRAFDKLNELREASSDSDRSELLELARTHWPDPTLLSILTGGSSNELAEPTPLPAGELRSADPAIEEGVSRVQTLIARLRANSGLPEQRLVDLAADWRWECDEQGRITAASGTVAAGALGLAIADLDEGEAFWRACRRRAAFSDVAVVLDGRRWRLSGVPMFGIEGGRFVGFRGLAKLDEGKGAIADTEAFATVAHELRSPLNAIMGFAQMIESETLGPAPVERRREASTVLGSATQVLGALDDFTDVSRLDQGLLTVAPQSLDVEALLGRVAARYEPVATARGAKLIVTCPRSIACAEADIRLTERMLSRLVASALAGCEDGEALLVGASSTSEAVRVFVTRPAAWDGIADEALAFEVANDDASPARRGMAFSLRLARRLAAAAGARLTIELGRFVIELAALKAGVAKAPENA